MNPPFHLKKSDNPIYTRDIFDYDFIKRSYTMLKPNGVLVAIMSQRFQRVDGDDENEFNEFLDDFDKSNSSLENNNVKWEGKKDFENDEDISLSSISNLKISYLFLREQADITKKWSNNILDEQLYLFSDTTIQKAEELENAVGDLNEPIFDTKEELNKYEDEKLKLISNTEDDEDEPEKKEVKKLKIKSLINKNPLNSYLLRSKEKKTRSNKSYDENIIQPNIMFA